MALVSPSAPMSATYAQEIGRHSGRAVQGSGDGGRLSAPAPCLGCVAGQERCQMSGHSDRADAGSTAAVRDAERLVEIQVRHVAAELTRLREAHQRVEIGTVDVHLTAGVVHFRRPSARPLRTHRGWTGR